MSRTRGIVLFLVASSFIVQASLLPCSMPAKASNSSKQSLKERMNASFHVNHFKESYAWASQVLKIDPTDTDALVVTGCSLTGQHRPKEAEPYFRKAMQLKPKRPDYIAHHIADLVFLRRYKDAKKELPTLYAVDPNFDYGKILEVKIDLLQEHDDLAIEKATRLLPRDDVRKGLVRELSDLWEVINFERIPKATLSRFAGELKTQAENVARADFLRALTYIATGRFSDASQLAQRLAQYAPETRFHINIMHRLAHAGQNNEAIKCLPSTGIEATNPQTVCNRIHLLTTLGRNAEALQLSVKEGAAFAVKNQMFGALTQCARNLSDPEESKAVVAMLQNESDPDWLVFFIAAMIFDEQQRHDDAIRAYEKAFQDSDCSANVALEYCALLVEKKMYLQAQNVLQRVRNNRVLIMPIYARILVLLKRPKEALAMLEKYAVQNHSSKSETLLGDLYRQLGRPMEALDHYNHAVSLEPKSNYIRQRRLDFARLIRRYDIVCLEIDNSLKKSPDSDRLYFQKAIYEELSGHHDVATSAWNRALALKANRR